MVINPRTPTDIPLSAEEEGVLLASHADGKGVSRVRWWLIREDGSLEDVAEQERLRPADARACFGDYYTPWYASSNHIHNVDRGPMAWGIHAYGTEEAVRAVHHAALVRLGRR
jgi:hypothetical protein